MPRRPTIARKTKYVQQLSGTALTLDQFTNKLMHGGKRQLAHRILERERLEDAYALQRLLQGLENPGTAGELMVRNRLDAANHLTQEQHGRRHYDDAERRQDGILYGHDRNEPDKRQQIAAEGRDEEVEHLARGGGTGGEARHELRAVAVGKETDVMLEQPGEHPSLIVGNDPIADPCEHHRLPVGGYSLDHEEHGGHQGEDDDARKVFVNVGLVDDVSHQIRAERRARGRYAHQRECKRVTTPLPRRLLHEQAADQRGRAVGIRK